MQSFPKNPSFRFASMLGLGGLLAALSAGMGVGTCVAFAQSGGPEAVSPSPERELASRSSRKKFKQKPSQPRPAGSSGPSEATETPQSEPRRAGKKREKEIEGSQALNRFESDSVIRSQYQHQGKSLEVDPD